MLTERDERKTMAQSHIDNVLSLYADQVNRSVEGIREFSEIDSQKPADSGLASLPEISSDDVIGCSLEAVRNGFNRACVLDFASYTRPGGGFKTGALAQEESLCMKTSLYPVLRKRNDWYKYNKKHVNRGLYGNRGLLVPDILFFDEANVVAGKLTVAVVAAPNKGVALSRGVSEADCDLAMRQRVAFAVRIMSEIKPDVMILGAFGCGVFRNNPRIVARSFIDALSSCPSGTRVMFSLPEERVRETFVEEFKAAL